MNVAGRLGGRPVLAPLPGWTFGQPRRTSAAYLVRRAVWKVARQRHFGHRAVAPWLYGTRAELVLSSDIGRCVWVAGCYEPNELYFLSRMLKPGGTFIDVGANIGLYSLVAARIVGFGGRVLAFEPSSRERELLESNIVRNHLTQVVVDSRALGNEQNSHAVLHLADDQHGGQNTLGTVVYENVRLVRDAEVEMTTLDHVVAERGLDSVDVVKIDVEGAEFAVLSGAYGILTAPRPVIMMELQDDSLVAQGSSGREVIAVLSRFGYELYCYAITNHQRLLRRFEDREASVGQDVVAVPAEKKALIIAL